MNDAQRNEPEGRQKPVGEEAQSLSGECREGTSSAGVKAFNYYIEIKLCDAQTVMGGKLEDETNEEYSARYKAAEGKFFLRAVMRDHSSPTPQHIAVQSPHFEYVNHNPAMPPMSIMQVLTTAMVQRETEK